MIYYTLPMNMTVLRGWQIELIKMMSSCNFDEC